MNHDPRSFAGLADARRVLAPLTDPSGRVIAALEDDAPMEDVEHFWDESLAARGLVRRRDETATVRARVDHGRWLADCPGPCRGMDAALVIPGWDRACCLGCGTEFGVVFPAWLEIADATMALSVRPVELRNWNPVLEPASALVAENARRGL